jgi:hypothetical protein
VFFFYQTVHGSESSFISTTTPCIINPHYFPQVWTKHCNFLVATDPLLYVLIPIHCQSYAVPALQFDHSLCILSCTFVQLIAAHFIVIHGFRNVVTRVSWSAMNGTGSGQHRQVSLYLDEVCVEPYLHFVTWCSDYTQGRTLLSPCSEVAMFLCSAVPSMIIRAGYSPVVLRTLREHLGHCFQ